MMFKPNVTAVVLPTYHTNINTRCSQRGIQRFLRNRQMVNIDLRFLVILYLVASRGSSVGTATGYGLEGRGSDV